jgi:hypothetical protein
MKECPYCARPLDDAAVVCKRCGSPSTYGLEQSQQRPAVDQLPAMPRLGGAYGLVTGGLVVTICLSGWCWSRARNDALHATCLAVWALAGILLTVSQVVFIVLAVKAKGNDARLIVLLLAAIVMAMIGLFVLALANMPS